MMHVLIVGSGIAGLTAALHAQEAGHEVTLIAKGSLGGGCTPLAQGGVAGVYGPGDSADSHASDTLIAGAGLSEPAAVDVLVTEGEARIADLIARGVAFDRDPSGALLLGREAAHSHARIVHAGGDATGAAISEALVRAVRSAGVTVREQTFLVDLAVEGGSVRGIHVLVEGAEKTWEADAVILATGGAGRLYAHTTNPEGATGDGIAAALRAGAAVADLEFMQFHPTMLATGSPFLISEAVRGEGAVLVDADGFRFMLDEHPDAELAPRDIVARAIARRAGEQGSPVRLDATALGARHLIERFPAISRATRERGLDWAREPIPVTPAAHYLMGGIVTDLDGRTSLPGLFAVGECARTGVHGANRLASNSLLEGAVFGARAAAALSGAHGIDGPRLFRVTERASVSAKRSAVPRERHRVSARERFARPRSTTGSGNRALVQRLMWEKVGLLRTDEGLADAAEQLAGLALLPQRPLSVREHEDANLLLLATATVRAALARTESVGAHFRAPALIGAPC